MPVQPAIITTWSTMSDARRWDTSSLTYSSSRWLAGRITRNSVFIRRSYALRYLKLQRAYNAPLSIRSFTRCTYTVSQKECLLQLEETWTNIRRPTFWTSDIPIIRAANDIYNFVSNLMFSYFILHFFRVTGMTSFWIFSHVTAVFINTPFNKDHILIKNLYRLKGYTAQKLLK